MSFALDLASHINALRYDDLPEQAVHWAKVGILDTVGVTFAGSGEPAAQIVMQTLAPGDGPCLLFGTGRRSDALNAALINGTASHALDFDDCNNTLGGHPSVPILPALFALAEETGAGGRQFIAAYVAGFETETRISRGVNFYQYTKGWHPTATIGIFGTAAACARLLELDDETTATALAIAASLAAGIKSNFGTMVKPLHIGQCTRNGLFAALLARNGFSASAVAFEHRQGYFEVFNGAGNYDASKILRDWAAPLDIVTPGIAIKQYPCCGSTHPAIDMMLKLVRAHDIDAERIERIDAWLHERRLEHTNRPDPRNALDAKFSLQYCLARAATERKVVIEHFQQENIHDSRIRALLPHVHVAPYTDAQFPPDNHFGAEVKITLQDGKTYSAKTEHADGRTSENPLSADQLREKFMNCMSRAAPRDTATRLYDAIQRFERIESVRDMLAGI
ncbi:MAG: MmgE/PrpD family protein [Burkholderiales bacterium]